MVGVDVLQKKEPHFIPGYTGYCPQHRFECGQTFGDLSYKLLCDSTVKHAKKLVLVDRLKQHEVEQPTKEDIEVINSRKRVDPVYKHPMLSTYCGFIPNLSDERDKPYGIKATEGIANFERQQVKKRTTLAELRRILELQSGSRYPETEEDRLLLKNKYKMPLIRVHPERIGFTDDYFKEDIYEQPKDYVTSPYFMDNVNPDKYFKHGYTGYRPHRTTYYGKTHQVMTNRGLQDFTTKYLENKRLKWTPVVLSAKKILPPQDGVKIYLKDTALMPSYTGHIPGAKYKIGKTRGYCSKNAHRYIEERLFALKYSKCPSTRK